MTGVPLGARVSPVPVAGQPGHGDEVARPPPPRPTEASWPRSDSSTWSRSSVRVRGLVRTASGRRVPDSTLQSEIRPACWSVRVLQTTTSGWAVGVAGHLGRGVAGQHGDRRPLGRGGAQLDQQPGQSVDAHPGGPRAAQDREHRAGGHPAGQGVLELLAGDGLALEVAGHEVVVAHHDALDQLLVDLVLGDRQVVGDRALGAGDRRPGAEVVEGGPVVEQVDHARGSRPRRRWAAPPGPRRRRRRRGPRPAPGRSRPAPGRAC